MNIDGPLNVLYRAPIVPPRIEGLRRGVFGIEYDFNSGAIQRRLPGGWGSRRSYVYGQVGRILNGQGFRRTQYSSWRKHCSPIRCWASMFAIFNMPPFGLVETTIQGLSMYQLTSALMDVTRKVSLGQQHSRVLRGLTPVGLVSQPVRNILQRGMGRNLITPEPHHLDPLPRGVRNTLEAREVRNWAY